MSRTAEILREAAQLIEPEGAWTQGHGARDAQGNPAAPDDPEAVCWCACGAITRVAEDAMLMNDEMDMAYCLLEMEVGNQYAGSWNDAPGRTQAEVVAALRAAAERAA